MKNKLTPTAPLLPIDKSSLLIQVIALILGGLFLLLPTSASAIVDPLNYANNRFGIHIIDENDLDTAANLVNSGGGDWGYVTVVIRQNDRDHQKWQKTFDRMRELHLIPLVRLATQPEGDSWKKPHPEDVKEWVSFLNSLNWVVKNRYIILFNEPNHAKEWGGELKPHEYATIAKVFHQELKAASEDFFILPAGFDAAAPNGPDTMEMTHYWSFMQAHDPAIFSIFDGWTSHSYPNPGFVGSPNDTGKMSIRGYRWEVEFLKRYRLKPNIPVFITETGWIHNANSKEQGGISPQRLSTNYRQAFTQTWIDRNLVAITPFVLNYPNYPFSHFSWFSSDSISPLPHFDAVKELPKNQGKPLQTPNAELASHTLPASLITSSHYQFALSFKNTGQTIWNPQDYQLVARSKEGNFIITAGSVPITKPFENAEIRVALETPRFAGYYPVTFHLEKSGRVIGSEIEKTITVIPPPSLLVKAKLWFNKLNTGNDFTLIIYDQGEVVKKYERFSIEDGVGVINNVSDVVPNQLYRFVLIKPFYLPRQQHAYLNANQTVVEFKQLLPIDIYADGKFNFKDIYTAIKHPGQVLELIKR